VQLDSLLGPLMARGEFAAGQVSHCRALASTRPRELEAVLISRSYVHLQCPRPSSHHDEAKPVASDGVNVSEMVGHEKVELRTTGENNAENGAMMEHVDGHLRTSPCREQQHDRRLLCIQHAHKTASRRQTDSSSPGLEHAESSIISHCFVEGANARHRPFGL